MIRKQSLSGSSKNRESGSTSLLTTLAVSGVVVGGVLLVQQTKVQSLKSKDQNNKSIQKRSLNESAIELVSHLVGTGVLVRDAKTQKMIQASSAAFSQNQMWSFDASGQKVDVKVCSGQLQQGGLAQLFGSANDTKALTKVNSHTCLEGQELLRSTVTFRDYQSLDLGDGKTAYSIGVTAESKASRFSLSQRTQARVSLPQENGSDFFGGDFSIDTYLRDPDMCFFMQPVRNANGTVSFDAEGRPHLEPRPEGRNKGEFKAAVTLPQPPAGVYGVIFQEQLQKAYDAGYRNPTLFKVDLNPSNRVDVGVMPNQLNGPRFQYFLQWDGKHNHWDPTTSSYNWRQPGTRNWIYNTGTKHWLNWGCGRTLGAWGADFCTRVDLPYQMMWAEFSGKAKMVQVEKTETVMVEKEVEKQVTYTAEEEFTDPATGQTSIQEVEKTKTVTETKLVPEKVTKMVWEERIEKLPEKYRMESYTSTRCVYTEYYKVNDPQRCSFKVSGATCRTGDGCFASDTRIRMADGSQKSISSIQPGEWVFNPVTLKATQIAHKSVGVENKKLWKVTLDTKKAVVVTQTHPFKTLRGLLQAKELQADDFVYSEHSEKWEKIFKIEEILGNGKTVVNLALKSDGQAENIDEHFLVADGVVTGDLVVQIALEKKRFSELTKKMGGNPEEIFDVTGDKSLLLPSNKREKNHFE